MNLRSLLSRVSAVSVLIISMIAMQGCLNAQITRPHDPELAQMAFQAAMTTKLVAEQAVVAAYQSHKAGLLSDERLEQARAIYTQFSIVQSLAVTTLRTLYQGSNLPWDDLLPLPYYDVTYEPVNL